MSIAHSISVDSSTSTATMTTLSPTDLPDTSNDLYEDRDHFQSIFTNDSRFFDTSLHLFKSYYALGYIPTEEVKHKKLIVPVLRTTSNGHRHRWRARLLGSNHNNDNYEGTIKGFLTPILLRKSVDQSTRVRSESSTSATETINRHRKSPMIVHYQPIPIPTINIPDIMKSDESEITITRL